MTTGGEASKPGPALHSAAARGLRLAAKAFDRLRPPPTGSPIFIYHRVGGRTPTRVDLPVAQFREQMEMIAPVAASMDEALKWLDGAETAHGAPPVVVTFDDGTLDVVDEALPICVELKIPLLLYVATRFVDEQIELFGEGRPATWSQLADGMTSGYLHIGSHTHSHALLDRLPAGAVDQELDRSIALIQDRLGVDPVHFAYPKALPGNPAGDAAVRHRFVSAAVGGGRLNLPGQTDPWSLSRIPVQAMDSREDFNRKLAGGLRLEVDVKNVLNKVRYRGLTS